LHDLLLLLLLPRLTLAATLDLLLPLTRLPV
jgi:hypothetical protein